MWKRQKGVANRIHVLTSNIRIYIYIKRDWIPNMVRRTYVTCLVRVSKKKLLIIVFQSRPMHTQMHAHIHSILYCFPIRTVLKKTRIKGITRWECLNYLKPQNRNKMLQQHSWTKRCNKYMGCVVCVCFHRNTFKWLEPFFLKEKETKKKKTTNALIYNCMHLMNVTIKYHPVSSIYQTIDSIEFDGLLNLKHCELFIVCILVVICSSFVKCAKKYSLLWNRCESKKKQQPNQSHLQYDLKSLSNCAIFSQLKPHFKKSPMS